GCVHQRQPRSPAFSFSVCLGRKVGGRAGVTGGDVGTDDLERAVRNGQGDGSRARGQVADLRSKVVLLGHDPADDHYSVITVVRLGIGDVETGHGERLGEQTAASALLGLGEHKDVLAALGEPGKLSFGAFGSRVGNV